MRLSILISRTYLPLLVCFCLPLVLIGCDDDPTTVADNGNPIVGQVNAPNGERLADIPVYLAQRSVFAVKAPITGNQFAVIDSTVSGSNGKYTFTGLKDGEYSIYGEAGQPGQWNLVSRIVHTALVTSGKGSAPEVDVDLFDVVRNGQISGKVIDEYSNETFEHPPLPGAQVYLHYIHGASTTAIDSTLSDELGEFIFSNVATGNYYVLAIADSLSTEIGPFFCDGATSYDLGELMPGAIICYKPAVYIYPETAGIFNVQLEPYIGSEILTTIPEYGDGWEVFVDTDGRIDNTWDYLFYESSQQFSPSLREGVCLAQEDLAAGLAGLLKDKGLNAVECDDFLEYWLPRLTDYDFYCVYPLMTEGVDQFIGLNVQPTADATLRIWLYFQGRNDSVMLPAPSSETFVRGATTVVEWGGAFLD